MLNVVYFRHSKYVKKKIVKVFKNSGRYRSENNFVRLSK